MKTRDVILGLTSGSFYLLYGMVSQNLQAIVQAVLIIAAVGVTTSIYAVAKGKLE